jgi:NAD/NADP transhydrogenase beta subunit
MARTVPLAILHPAPSVVAVPGLGMAREAAAQCVTPPTGRLTAAAITVIIIISPAPPLIATLKEALGAVAHEPLTIHHAPSPFELP